MRTQIELSNRTIHTDLSEPIDISIPLRQGVSVNAFHIPYARFEPLRAGSFVGSVAEGGSANCENLLINAHGNGTHTECVGHISKQRVHLNDCLKRFHFIACLSSVYPVKKDNGDKVVDLSLIDFSQIPAGTEALIIRTQPNQDDKLMQHYSGNNPTYLDAALTQKIREHGIKHLLIDLPSVDREEDKGLLLAHHAFWNYPADPQLDMTITEMVYVPDHVKDGEYLLNIQISSIESDASPSKIILFRLR